ncbi:unnamed protein product [Linum trigynum]|uniref:Uncharacterized protein n=1 Tax=Linum trigynum TaxID=586398 RepID=A0AAV2CM00_9ROSI
METNYVYASVDIEKIGPSPRRCLRRHPPSQSSLSSWTHLKFTFSYQVHHLLVHQPEVGTPTLLRRSSDPAVSRSLWLGTTGAFSKRPHALYEDIASVWCSLGIDERFHHQLFEKLVAEVRDAADCVSPKLMFLPLRVAVVRDHLVLLDDGDPIADVGEEEEVESVCSVDFTPE